MFVGLLTLAAMETHPPLLWQRCTKIGCTEVKGSVVVDVSSRSSATADVDYSAQLGVFSSGHSLTQKFVTIYNGVKNVGSRLYLLNSTGLQYQTFTLVNKELTYDVDLTELPCGMNAAIYTTEMSPSAGPEFGGGYCDANFVGGVGCSEFDIMEANSRGNVFTTHPCSLLGQHAKGQVMCQSDGCGFNAYRYGATQFYGPGPSYTVDTSKPFTVVTQFISSNKTDLGDLTEIRRVYVQGGKVILNAKPRVYNTAEYDSITDKFCQTAGHGVTEFTSLRQMGNSFKAGHVLIFSLWDSTDSMTWLDAGEYGPCLGGTEESAQALEKNHPNIKVVWSNIRYGDIDSTY